MVTELIRDNRQIVERMQSHHIDAFIQLLFKNQVRLITSLNLRIGSHSFKISSDVPLELTTISSREIICMSKIVLRIETYVP